MTYYLLFLMGGVGITEIVGLGRESGQWKRALKPTLWLMIAGIVGVYRACLGSLKRRHTHSIQCAVTKFWPLMRLNQIRDWQRITSSNTVWLQGNGGPSCVLTLKAETTPCTGENKRFFGWSILFWSHCLLAVSGFFACRKGPLEMAAIAGFNFGGASFEARTLGFDGIFP